MTNNTRTDEILDPAQPHIMVNEASSVRVGDRVRYGTQFYRVIRTEVVRAPHARIPDAIRIFIDGADPAAASLEPGDRAMQIIRAIRVGDQVRSRSNPNIRSATVTAVMQDSITVVFEDDATATVAEDHVFLASEGERPQ